MDINDAWKKTCNVLFGGEIGELDEFKDYFCEHHYNPLREEKSAQTGKTVAIGAKRYCEGARFLSEDEIAYDKKYPALSINEIKDLDSLAGAFSDRYYYAGNKIFGTSKFVQEVDNCTDSFYVYKSHNVVSSKYVAYSNFVRDNSEFIFGAGPLMRGSHQIRVMGSESLSRGFECSATVFSSDMFVAFNCRGCTECMFSFNLKSRKYCIGNLELPKDRYLQVKKKLVDETREYLKKHKRFYSVFDFASPPSKEAIARVHAPKVKRAGGNMAPIESTFRSTTKLIFGKELTPIDKYAKFLSERIEPISPVKTAFGNNVWYSDYIWNWCVPKNRMASREEADEAAKQHIELPDGDEISVKSIMDKAANIAFYGIDMSHGNNSNNIQNPIEYGAVDCYKVSDGTYSKKCGYCTHVQRCEGVFGSSILMIDSTFSLRCHDCVKVNACMDMDSCKNCHRCMFCHNCEGLSDCLFCFNTKNKTYAIGNVEIGRENYLKIRKMVVDEIFARLEKTGTIGFDICNLGCYGKNKVR